MNRKEKTALYVRNSIFGVEDSLVSSVGVLSGLAVANTDKEIIILTGIILIFVEAFSMGVGSFLSEQSAEEYIHKHKNQYKYPIIGGVIMFFSYFLAGFIPLSPYLLLEPNIALKISIVLALITLFVLGSLSTYFSGRKNIIKNGLRMLFIGGFAVIIGSFVATLI